MATGSLSTLVFSAQDDTGFFSLDDVSVVAGTANATPEPAGYGLMGTALALLALLGRRGWAKKGEVCRQ